MQKYYNILGLDKNCSQKDIRSAYKKYALKYHPDKNNNDQIHVKKFIDISNAYEILSDKKKRKEYDLTGDINHYDFSSPLDIFTKIFNNNIDDNFEIHLDELSNKPEVCLYLNVFMNIHPDEKKVKNI